MPQLFSTSRAEAAISHFPPLFYPLAVMFALAAQAYLPVIVHAAVYLDLPLLVVVYWALNTRNAGSAALLGAGTGLVQDSLAHLALGVNGIAKTIIGYLAAAVGARMEADHAAIRFLSVVVAVEVNRAVLWTLEGSLLGTPVPWRGLVTAAAASANAVLAVMLFHVFDRFRHAI